MTEQDKWERILDTCNLSMDRGCKIKLAPQRPEPRERNKQQDEQLYFKLCQKRKQTKQQRKKRATHEKRLLAWKNRVQSK